MKMFKRQPTPLQIDEQQLTELLVSRAAWEKELMNRKIAVRASEAKVAEAAEALDAAQSLIYKLQDRIAAAKIDAEEASRTPHPPSGIVWKESLTTNVNPPAPEDKKPMVPAK